MKHKSLAPAFSTMPPLPCMRAANTARVGARLFTDFPHIKVPLLRTGTPSENLLLLFPEAPIRINITELGSMLMIVEKGLPDWVTSYISVCSRNPEEISVARIIRNANTRKAFVDLWYRLTQSERGPSLEIRPSRDAKIQKIHSSQGVEKALKDFGIPNITALPQFKSYIKSLGTRS
jgi:hypothetical protein